MMITGGTPAHGRILIISEGILASLGPAPTFLRRSSVYFLPVRTGSEALTLAGASDPALLLLDYAMPVLRGDQVCRKIRADERLREIPVIIIGPPEPAEVGVSCRESGCSLFTPAPVDFLRLLPRIAEYLGIPPRLEDRIPVVLSVSYGTVTTEVLGHSLDLSTGGILVRTPIPLRVGYFVSLKFYPDATRRPILAPGKILRVVPTEEGEYDVGVQFLTLPRESVERIEKLMERHRDRQPPPVAL